jgi:hypothetical protein
MPTNNRKLVKREKSDILTVTLPLVPSSFAVCLHAHTLRDTQLSKVGKTEKTEPAVSRYKSPNQRSYENMRSRSVPCIALAQSARNHAIAQGAVAEPIAKERRREAIAGISLPLFG